MARIDVPALTTWITAAALQHPHDLPQRVAERCGVTRPTALRALRKLVGLGWLTQAGTGQRSRWQPGVLRQVVQRYPLHGLEEHGPWVRDFAPCFLLEPAVRRMAEHAFTELLNNAVDHSEGSQVTVSLRQTAAHLQLLVADDGRGLFDKLSSAFALDDPQTAMFELSKGKLTSAPERHCGHGLHFTAQLADVFQLHANASAFQRRQWDATGWRPGNGLPRRGTSVYWAIALDTRRTLDGVLQAASVDGAGYGFERTAIPLSLLTGEHSGLASRSQARRVGARLGSFRRAEIDFAGVPSIGQGFADELFRVFAREHPEVELVPVNMLPAVAAQVASVRP